ncbi:predicted protein [Sclerotinia sclerotiorum 1980 UF-70]|uniref:Tyrosinase copper-binding domain-containing protein n=1 Tax=Sclerotinia sclerotiorum (strain ATCC 18683 / 1980 / Ss-1) TaxID=665079 RepID=A7F8S6_SCLS1|nr:predicted protein [Sclerotinia sclerotiorum 1980 UF-70]EDN99147.1 predicted protein [Sclerotinia sclerotiorum 1980 UF-70]
MVSKTRIGVLIAGLIGVAQGEYWNTTTAIVTPVTSDGNGLPSTCEPKTVTVTSPSDGYGSYPTETVTSTSVSVSTATYWETTTIDRLNLYINSLSKSKREQFYANLKTIINQKSDYTDNYYNYWGWLWAWYYNHGEGHSRSDYHGEDYRDRVLHNNCNLRDYDPDGRFYCH